MLLAVPAAASAVSCGETIRTSATLQSDLRCDGVGLTIGAPGITLDLGGHQLAARSGAAILNPGYDDVTVKNGSVAFSNDGILLQGVSGNVVRDVSLTGLQNGIELTGSDHNRIVSNRLTSVWIRLRDGSDDNVIRGNTVLSYEGLIWIVGSSHNRVVKNVISDAMESSVTLNKADHTLVSDNDITALNGRGVGLSQANDNQVSDNTVHGKPNGENPVDVEGVTVDNSHRNLLLRNTFQDTTTAIHVVSGWANQLRRNQALFGLKDGFLVDPTAVGTILLRNAAFANGDDGFDIQASSSRLGRNGAAYNRGYGIKAVPGVVDLGGNTATNNTGPAQCLNVACK
jgi:parallel beta-helix repeat protein